ncbi:MAG: hypothetical protein ABTQ34_02690 [Bdellovibrionales bacterium]
MPEKFSDAPDIAMLRSSSTFGLKRSSREAAADASGEEAEPEVGVVPDTTGSVWKLSPE